MDEKIGELIGEAEKHFVEDEILICDECEETIDLPMEDEDDPDLDPGNW